MSIANPQTPVNVAVEAINKLSKIEGTHDWHTSQWFADLADYSNLYDNGQVMNACGEFRQWREQTPNRRNVQKWRDYIASLVPYKGEKPDADNNEIIPADLQKKLLAHLDDILTKKKPLASGFRHMFSRSKKWTVMRDISSASCFLNAFSQACNYGR